MKIYILFGKTGAGKSFIGEYLRQAHNFIHFDADQLLTAAMKNYIRLEKPMLPGMIDEYISIFQEKIRFFYQNMTVPVVISQGLYRNKNRLAISRQFPDLCWVLVTAEESLCYQRVRERNNWVTEKYARKINELFEPPEGFDYRVVHNNSNHIPEIFNLE